MSDELANAIESFLMDASREFYSYRSTAGVVGLETGYGNEPVRIDCHALADAILAAGWRPPEEHIHDWHSTPNYVWCQCGAERRTPWTK